MISSIAWVPKGVADPNPKRYEISNTERELLSMLEQEDPKELEAKLMEKIEKRAKKVKSGSKKESSLPADLRMDEYSSDEDDGMAIGELVLGKDTDLGDAMVPEDENENIEGDTNASQGSLHESETVSDHDSDDDDDLADVPDTREFTPVNVEGLEAMGLAHSGATGGMYAETLGQDEDDDSEMEEVKLSADDAIVVVAKTEEDFASLEVHVYDQETGNLFVHHDIPLPSYPLCLAHGQVSSSGTTGNFCAVGTFSPGIEIWNLDVLNALEPSCILGGEDTSAMDDMLKLQMMRAASGSQPPRMSKKSMHNELRPGSHTDAVIALSWNPIHRQVIASGSADCTVKLWDVTQADSATNEKCNAGTFSHHRDKVQSVLWHPKEGTLLATGSFDRTVALLDARSNGENVKSVKLTADCEAMAWDPHHPEYLTVASEDGTITCWDVRQFRTNTPLWSFVANEYGGVSDLAYNQNVPGLMTTCSTDATVTLWDAHQNGHPTANAPPRSCGSKDMCVGKLYAVDFYPSSPWLLGCGGSGNQLSLWDLSGEKTIRSRFDDRLEGTPHQADPDESAQQDFEAMMADKSSASKEASGERPKNKKKGKGKGKRKVHRRGR